MNARPVSILEAADDPRLFAPWFRDPPSWRAWRAFLAALFALPMGDEALALYRARTGRSEPPEAAFSEAWLICGRRAGKSFTMALVGAYLATFRDYRAHLAPGERATVALIASDRRQARVLRRYVGGFLAEVPMLARMVERETVEGFELSNRVAIEIHTASFRAVRGYSLAAALCDELAFWPDADAASPDEEILAALRPGLASIPGSMLLCASSPHSRRGELWNAYRRWHGQDGAPVLVWQADTRTMNPDISERIIADAYARDPARAAAEYGAQFRADIEGFIDAATVEALTEPGLTVRGARPRVHRYFAFVDMSGGRSDSAALAIAHREGERTVLDLVVERRAPHDPEDVAGEFVGLLRSYGVSTVTGDKYAGQWTVDAYKRRGIRYVHASRSKSEIYVDALPLLTAGTCDLLDLPRLTHQLTSLERRALRSGREVVDHAPGSHDDVANAALGALVHAGRSLRNQPAVAPMRGLV